MTTETQTASGAAENQVAPAESVNESPEVTTPESNETEHQPKEKPEQEDSEKSLKRLQRRVDRVTAARYQAEAEARHFRELYEREAQSRTQNQDDQQQPIRPEDVDRLATERAQEIAQTRDMQRAVNTVLEQGKAIAAFDELCNTVNEEVPFYDNKHRPTPFLEAVLDSDKPHELLAYLGQNPDMAAELHGLSAARLGRRIEAIERDMKASRVSKAPVPIKPVTPKGSPVPKNAADMTDAEWYAQRRKRS